MAPSMMCRRMRQHEQMAATAVLHARKGLIEKQSGQASSSKACLQHVRDTLGVRESKVHCGDAQRILRHCSAVKRRTNATSAEAQRDTSTSPWLASFLPGARCFHSTRTSTGWPQMMWSQYA